MRAVQADAAEPDEVLVDEGTGASDWSSDGRFILYAREGDPAVRQGPLGQRDVWALPLERPRMPFPVLATRFHETSAQFSPDGHWIAYQSNASGPTEIYVQPFSVPVRPSQSVQVTNGRGEQARWRADAKELFYLAPGNRLMAVTIELDARTGNVEVGSPLPLLRPILRDNAGSRRTVSDS